MSETIENFGAINDAMAKFSLGGNLFAKLMLILIIFSQNLHCRAIEDPLIVEAFRQNESFWCKTFLGCAKLSRNTDFAKKMILKNCSFAKFLHFSVVGPRHNAATEPAAPSWSRSWAGIKERRWGDPAAAAFGGRQCCSTCSECFGWSGKGQRQRSRTQDCFSCGKISHFCLFRFLVRRWSCNKIF